MAVSITEKKKPDLYIDFASWDLAKLRRRVYNTHTHTQNFYDNKGTKKQGRNEAIL